MLTEFEATYHALEEKHWWFMARRDIVLSLIRDSGVSKDAAILEVGCSGGPLMLSLRQHGYSDVHGIDISETAIALAKSRGVANVQVMDAAKLDFDDERFDLLVASDVLEHIQDDRAALASWRRVLKPGGKLIVFVPAFQALWSNHDVVNQHYRRYTRRGLARLISDSGFEVRRTSYWNFGLVFPVGTMRLMMRLLPQRNGETHSNQLSKTNPLVNRTLFTMLRAENALFRRGVNWPIGVSACVLATRR